MNVEEFKEQQIECAKKVITIDKGSSIKTIAGCDCSYLGSKIAAAIVVCDEKMNVLDKATAVTEATFPYIQGMLYFREGEAIKQAYEKLKQKPDVMLVDGHGVLHPLRCGIASQLGVELDQRTIGVSKSKLVGDEDEVGNIRIGNDILGAEVKLKEHSKPLCISPGHKVSLETAVDIVQKTTRHPHKLPEPLHLAHRLADSTAAGL